MKLSLFNLPSLLGKGAVRCYAFMSRATSDKSLSKIFTMWNIIIWETRWQIRCSHEKNNIIIIISGWRGGKVEWIEWRQQNMTHLWPALFAPVTQTTSLSHLKRQCHDDLSSTDTTSQPLPQYRGNLTRAMKVTKERLVSCSAFIWLKPERSEASWIGAVYRWLNVLDAIRMTSITSLFTGPSSYISCKINHHRIPAMAADATVNFWYRPSWWARPNRAAQTRAEATVTSRIPDFWWKTLKQQQRY